MRCHQCGSSDVDVDPARSDVVCMECGAVLSDVSIVSEVNFSEQPSGLSSVVGQFVSLSGSRGLSSSAKRGVGVGGVSSAGYGRDSREQTLSVGRKLLQQLSDTLRLRAIHVDQAYGHFKLAVQHNFIQGRRTRYVAASCMYVACRKSKTPHLLLDLADALQVNLYMLGATLLKLLRVLHISLPIVDPSLYIHRFAAQLQLQPNQTLPNAPHGKEPGRVSSTHMVAMTALRLVSRMKRDWLQVGRRPSGICGACLLIACRMHGYRRSHREILDVVRVCDATLRRRLLEFVSTGSSAVTFGEFEAANAAEEGVEPSAVLDDGHNPPAFTHAQQRDSEAERAGRRKQEVAAQLMAKGIVEADVARQWEAEVSQLLQLPAFAQLEDRQPVTLDADVSVRHLINEHCRSRDKQAQAGSGAAVKADLDNAELVIALNADSCVDVDTVKQMLANQRAAALRAADTLQAADVKPNANDSSTGGLHAGAHTATGLDRATASSLSGQSEAVSELSHLDDAELDECILSEEEVAFRSRMWEDTHADYIKAQLEKKAQLDAGGSHSNPHSGQQHSADAQAGRGGRVAGDGGENGAVGGGQSNSARKKAKLGQAAFFLSATGTPASQQPSQQHPADNKPTAHPGLDGEAGEVGSVQGDVSAWLSASDIASSASRAATHFPAASASARSTSQRQQQRRVSGKINYQRLKGLLDTSAADTSSTKGKGSDSEPSHAPLTRPHGAVAEAHGRSRKRHQPAQLERASAAMEEARPALSEREGDGKEEGEGEGEEEEEDESEEEADADECEPSAASLMRAEQADDGYDSMEDAGS